MSQKIPLLLNAGINLNKKKRTFSSNVETELALMIAEDDSTRFDNSKILKKINSSKKRKLSRRKYKRKKDAKRARIPCKFADECASVLCNTYAYLFSLRICVYCAQ